MTVYETLKLLLMTTVATLTVIGFTLLLFQYMRKYPWRSLAIIVLILMGVIYYYVLGNH